MNQSLVYCVVLLIFIVCIIYGAMSIEKRKPNIVFIIADDVGWNDVSYHGSDQISTPNIDALGYHGLLMRRHYTLQVCTPSRAAFLTGQYPIRLGMQGYPLSVGMPKFVPKDVNTLPATLKTLGYKTHTVGKWHLGYAKKEHTPLGYGYDSHYGYWNGYIGYFDHSIGNPINGSDLHNNYQPVMDKFGEYATDLFTERSIDIIEKHVESDPLFLVINHLAGHTGKTNIDNTTEVEVHDVDANNKKYFYIKNPIRRKYAEVIERMDKSVGDVVEALAKKNMLENSIIVFFSDNGAPTYGLHQNTGSNYPLRGIKMTLYEGGIKTPSVIYSPLIKNKGNVYNGLFHITDWVPTILKAAGGNVNKYGPIDGIDQWENLVNNKQITERTDMLVDIDPKFDYGAYIGYGGRYKLVNNSYFSFDYTGEKGFTNPAFHYQHVKASKTNIYLEKMTNHHLTMKQILSLRYEAQINCNTHLHQEERDNSKPCDGGICLFDLLKDPCEYTDVKAQHPDILEHLLYKLDQLKRQAKPKTDFAIDPKSNPKFCNNTWFNWLDADGCWFNRNNSKHN